MKLVKEGPPEGKEHRRPENYYESVDVYYRTFFLWALLGLQVQRFVGQ